MKKIEIIDSQNENTNEIIQMTEHNILSLIEKEGLIFVLQNYEVPESFILKWSKPNNDFEGLPKSIIISMLNLSEKFIKEAIETDYFEVEDIYELNMVTYSNLSEKFIKIYEKYINWERMILYLCSSEKIENIEKLEWIIEKFNLWKLISANNLPVSFIRKNKDKLDWNIVSIINDFSEEEKEEFDKHIPNYKEEWNDLNSSVDLSVKDIRRLVSNIKEQDSSRFEVKHTLDELSSEDIKKIKEMIQSGQINNF